MNKKNIIIGIACLFLLVSGICYSCAFRGGRSSQVQTKSLTDKGTKQELNQKSQSFDETDHTKKQNGVKNTANSTVVSIVPQEEKKEKTSQVYVHICGAVKNPGVYLTTAGSRVCDLIKMSGGLSKEAAGDFINQAEPVSDGQKIYIPTKKEVKGLSVDEYIKEDNPSDNEKAQGSIAQKSETSELIDINSADANELMNLPGIGQAKAESIIEYRTANGKFQKIEDLMKVSGIKEGLFNRISSYIFAK